MTITAEGERGMVGNLNVAAIVALAEHGIAPDIQDLLTHGNPSRGISPGALHRVVRAVLLALREPDDWMIDPVQEVFWPYLTDDVTMDHARKVAKQAIRASIQSILDRAILSERTEGEN